MQTHIDIVRGGWCSIREWRTNNPSCFLNLRGANLREANLRGADIREADLSEANLTRAILCNCNMHGTRISFLGRGIIVRFEEIESKEH